MSVSRLISTTSTANTSAIACTTVKSRWKIELIISEPMPGQREHLLDDQRAAHQVGRC